MKLEILQAFLTGNLGTSEFRSAISAEVEHAAKLAGKQGGSIPIYGEDDQFPGMTLTSQELHRLCSEFVLGRVSQSELSYISDVIQLSESIDFESPELSDAVFSMSDPEINGPFTIPAAEALMARLGPPNHSMHADAAATRHRR